MKFYLWAVALFNLMVNSADAKKPENADCAPETLSGSASKTIQKTVTAISDAESLKSAQNFIQLIPHESCVEVKQKGTHAFGWETTSTGTEVSEVEKKEHFVSGVALDREKNVDGKYNNRADLKLMGLDHDKALTGNKKIYSLYHWPENAPAQKVGHWVMVQPVAEARQSYKESRMDPQTGMPQTKTFESFGSILFEIGSPERDPGHHQIDCAKMPSGEAPFRIEAFKPAPGACFWIDGTQSVIVKDETGKDKPLPLCW